MPWTAAEAKSHTKKADTPAKQKKWAKIANAALKTYKGDEGKAIATANAAISDSIAYDGLPDGSIVNFLHDANKKKKGDDESDDDDDCDDDDDDDDDDDSEALSDSATVTACTVYDRMDMRDANVTYRADGSLVAMPRTARTGIQIYGGAECERPDMPTVRVYRPADEVFNKHALRSYTHRTVTLDHPDQDVTSGNWKDLAVGWTGDEILRDGETFRVPMTLADGAAVAAYRDKGIKELSWGYSCFLDWTPGKTADGQEYDAVQRKLRANHLAVVTAARGGSQLTIGDNRSPDNIGEIIMNDRTTNAVALQSVMIDGLTVQLDPQSAMIVDRALKGLEKQIADAAKVAKAKAEEAEEVAKQTTADKATIKDRDAKITAKDGEIEALKKQLTDAKKELEPAATDKRVLDRLALVRKAGKLMGDKLSVEGKPDAQIRKEVVVAKIGDQAAAWNDGMIEGAFNALEVQTGKNTDPRYTPIDQAVRAFGGQHDHMSPGAVRDKAYTDYDTSVQDAWKNQPGFVKTDGHA